MHPSPSSEILAGLRRPRARPAVTPLMPVHRREPGSAQDPVRSRDPKRGAARRRRITLALTLLTTAGGSVALVSCSTEGDGPKTAPSSSARPSAPDASSFSGSAPSAMRSAAESKEAAASERAASASSAAAGFDASVSAEAARAREEATAVLKKVRGGGNARSEVSVSGKPATEAGNVRVAVVTVVNRTDAKASYAVQVDFTDADREVVESRIVGARDLEPGERAQPLAVSRKPGDSISFASVAKAQRY